MVIKYVLPCHKFQPQNFFFFPFISTALYSGVRYGVSHHHEYLAHLSIPPKNLNGEHHPNAEPFRRCCGAARAGFHPPGSRIQPCTCPQGMQPLRLMVTPGLRLSLHRDFIRLSAQREMLLQCICSLRSDSRREWLASSMGSVSLGQEMRLWPDVRATLELWR